MIMDLVSEIIELTLKILTQVMVAASALIITGAIVLYCVLYFIQYILTGLL